MTFIALLLDSPSPVRAAVEADIITRFDYEAEAASRNFACYRDIIGRQEQRFNNVLGVARLVI